MPRQNKGGKKGKKAGKTGAAADPNELADMGIIMKPKTPQKKEQKSYMPGSDDAYKPSAQAAKSAKRTKSKSPAKKQ